MSEIDYSTKALEAIDKLKEHTTILKYRDGTQYLKLPNGVIKRFTKRAYELRKELKNNSR
jgi:hypothetical protein